MSARAAAHHPLAPVSLRDLRDIDPYPAYEAMRAVGDVLWDEGMAAWLVLGHDDCAYVERREDLFEEPTGGLPGAHEIAGRRDLRSLVGAQHDELHRALAHAWRPTPVAPLGPDLVRPLLVERLTALGVRSTMELFADLASVVPISVIAAVLGLEDRADATLREAKRWLEAVLAWRHTFGEDSDLRERAVEATRALEAPLLEVVRARRDESRDNTISALWAWGRDITPDWGERDVLDNAKFLFEAGSETTAFLMCSAVDRLLTVESGVRAATIADATAFARFLEEVLRHTTVVHVRARRATQDTRLAGVAIRAGDRILAVNGAANRDPRRWPDPARFDPGRTRLSSHLAFNVGPRHCAGAHLARLEVSEAVGALFRAFPDLERDPTQPAPAFLGFVARAWRPLHLRHAPRTPTAVRAAVRAATGGSSVQPAQAMVQPGQEWFPETLT